jgi:hypothetical protein
LFGFPEKKDNFFVRFPYPGGMIYKAVSSDFYFLFFLYNSPGRKENETTTISVEFSMSIYKVLFLFTFERFALFSNNSLMPRSLFVSKIGA